MKIVCFPNASYMYYTNIVFCGWYEIEELFFYMHGKKKKKVHYCRRSDDIGFVCWWGGGGGGALEWYPLKRNSCIFTPVQISTNIKHFMIRPTDY